MGQKFFLIDNNTRSIAQLAYGLFPKLWKLNQKDGIETHVRVLGYEEQEVFSYAMWDENDEKKLQQEINEIFLNAFRDFVPSNDDDLFKKKKALINDNVKMVYKKSHASAGSKAQKDIKEYHKLCDTWMKNPVNKRENTITNEANSCVEGLIERMGIVKGACVGLDLALLFDDIHRVKEEDKPILSMALYDRLSKNQECFLYSQYVFDSSFIQKWKDIYIKYYKAEKPPYIYQRKEMYAKYLTETFIKQMLNRIETAEQKDKGNEQDEKE